MKVIRVIFLVLLALGMIACNVLFIFFQTYDPDKYLPTLTAKVSSYIGRPVSIGYVGPGLSLRGLTLDVGPVIIPDDPAFTTQPFIEIQRIRMVPDWGAFLLHTGVHFRLVQLESPRIHFIISPEGKFNAAAVGAEIEPQEKTAPVHSELSLRDITFAPGQDNSAQPKPKAASWPVVEIKSIKIVGGTVSLIDQRASSFMDVWLKNINGKLYGFSFSRPFAFYFSARLDSPDQNIHASAGVTLNKDRRLVTVSGMKITADLTRLDPIELRGISPLEGIRGALAKFSGRLTFNLDDLQIIPSKSVKAKGDLDAAGFEIKDFNPVKMVFSHVPLPVSGRGLDAIVAGTVSPKLEAPDTVFDAARISFSLHDNTVFIDDALFKTGIFEFSAKGRVDRDLTTDIQTILRLSSDASGSLTGKFPGFKSLEDGSGRITMSAALKGVFPHLTYKPDKDFRKKSKKALWQEGGNILSTILGGR